METIEDIPRDRWGRPMIKPDPDAPGGKKAKPKGYRRVTTFIDVLENRYNLEQWGKRMVAKGMAHRHDLVVGANACDPDEDKKTLDDIAKQALDSAQASAKANLGTAVHKLCERRDRGQLPDINEVPDSHRADVLAYEQATAGMEHQWIEQLRVLDFFGGVAGTPDRISMFRGEVYIADIKTGSIDWGQLKMAMQLAIYAHAKPYDPVTGKRGVDTPSINMQRGIIIHLPQGTGQATLHWVDIQRGWAAVQDAAKVWTWRDAKGLMEPVAVERDPGIGFPHEAFGNRYDVLAAQAATVDDLRALWTRASENNALTEGFKAAVEQRRKELGA